MRSCDGVGNNVNAIYSDHQSLLALCISWKDSPKYRVNYL